MALCSEETELGRSVRKVASFEKDIIVSVCSSAYLDLAFNWLHTVSVLGLSSPLWWLWTRVRTKC
jgi:hypothetical protein